MKRIREIILDFTPLLDVTLIILFYFILFSHMGAAEAQKKADQQTAAAEAAKSAAAEEMQEAARMQEDAALQLAVLEDTDTHGAEIAAAMESYARGENLKLLLSVPAEGWTLRVRRGSREIAVLNAKQSAADLADAFSSAGYEKDDIILCELIYDADGIGTHQAYKAATERLETVRKTYPHLYISETDLSK